MLAGNSVILPLLMKLQKLIQSRTYKFYVGHIRGHTKLPGPLAQGNGLADSYTRIFMALEQAKDSHNLHHQNALALKRAFGITGEQARQIVKQCTTCLKCYGKWMLLTCLSLEGFPMCMSL